MARLHRRYRKRRARTESSPPRHNPPLFSDLMQWFGPGFLSFAATRFVTRVAATQIAKKKPSWGRHAGAIASIGSFLAAWYLGHRWSVISRYHTPTTVGSGIAAAQSLIQLYIPKLGWMISDASPEIEGTQLAIAQADPASSALVPVNEDPNEYTYNDEFDPGRYATPPTSGPGGPAPRNDYSDLAIDDAIGQSQNLGVFTN